MQERTYDTQLLWSKEIECRAAHMQALDTHSTKCGGSIDRERGTASGQIGL